MPDTYLLFVAGYLALWILFFGGLCFLWNKSRKLSIRIKEMERKLGT